LVPLDGIVIPAQGGDVISLDVYVSDVPLPDRLRSIEVGVPCLAEGGDSGSVSFVSPVIQSVNRVDFLFRDPRYCDSGTNIGLVCASAADCPGGDASPCVQATSFPVTDDGTCPVGGPRAATTTGIGVPAIVVTSPRNVATFVYEVSEDAGGEFEISLVPYTASDGCTIRTVFYPGFGECSPGRYSPARIVLTTAQCCDGLTCVGDSTLAACNAAGGFWNPNRTCQDTCACASTVECRDANSCTYDECTANGCHALPVQYGNVDGNAVGSPDLDDIMCTLRGFGGYQNCPNADLFPNCEGDGAINIGDILEVILAFSGEDPCACGP
jgi:hypothetical protein